MGIVFKVNISDKRAAKVVEDIAVGSQPEQRFYMMVAASTGIATLGLVQNSTAVVIGAMLVAPLMTPIFGIALSLIRGDAVLFGRAVRAEIAGVVLSVALGLCVGLIIPELEATQEMLSRTKPNLLDLLVAVLAGFAGAYALVDKHISPALPGVAIATAIVPPLANAGLCLALGAYYGALGSFLLFFANFVSILLVAGAIFLAGGMAREIGSIKSKDVVRKFGLAAIGFLIVAAIFSKGLYELVQERRLMGSINDVLTEELSHIQSSELEIVIHQMQEDKLFLLAKVSTSEVIPPFRVNQMEKALENRLDKPVKLFVRSKLSEDVSSTGSMNQVLAETLDGFFVSRKPDPHVTLKKTAKQIIREYMDTQPSLYVEEIEYLPSSDGGTILATIFGLRELRRAALQSMESEIRKRSGLSDVNLVVRYIGVDMYDRYGKLYFEWATLERLTPKQEIMIRRIEDFLKLEFSRGDFHLIDFQFVIREGTLHLLIELVGPVLFSREMFDDLKEKLTDIAGNRLQLNVRSKQEVVLTQSDDTSFKNLRDQYLKDFTTQNKDKLKRIFESAL